MIVAPVRATSLFQGNRLDARFFSSPAIRIREILAKNEEVTLRRIGGPDGLAKVRAPSRFKRTYAAPGEDFVPYLRPYDVFEFLPPEADRLSRSRTENLAEYLIQAGDLLQTCSGRNLGPLTIADEYLGRFALSHDMIRVSIPDEAERLYTLAFLRSATGQHLLRGDLSGSVIDHITVDQVSALQVPFIDGIQREVVTLMREAVSMREAARITLHDAIEGLNKQFDPAPATPLRDGWTVNASGLGTRLDAAFHAQHVRDARERIREAGGVRLGDVAQVRKPGGRYKTYYVDPEHGTPLLSGRQILQLDVVGAKSISARSIKADSGYELREGWICFQADGRAEESLGYPSVVTADRDGWYSSGHVGRFIPDDLADTGWLWAAVACGAVQEQIAALACGSVVDALYPEDLEDLILPPRQYVDGENVNAAWNNLAAAAEKAQRATGMIHKALVERGI
jgi:hypothetical protein